ncbi:winged helix-turn-helix transcriptional regulator [Azospira sp.]|uniref:winged helix-turn-helix transcriptional regulator n=1 Tax=Azospira sp. TaxID=1872671 RepID=UPI00256886E5|nr:helix-turn-helix domain-containing protein [Azospira sp.]MDK9691476.1 helix-turn-helix transcriptional regulator [Azospira sp.]
MPSSPPAVPAPTPAETPTLAELMRRGDVFSDRCPSREVLQHVTSRWGVLVLVALLEGTHRFSDLRRKVAGVSERMLAQTLQWLEADGLVRRQAFPVVPPHVEYSLTGLGREAGARVQALADWIEGNLADILAARETVQRDKSANRPK